MKVFAWLCALSLPALSLAQSSPAIAATLKSSKVMKDLVKQCEYVDGVVLRILASRECPVLETSIPTSIDTISATPPVVAAGSQQAGQSAIAQSTGDIVLDKAISRCTSIGFKRDTAEFRSCVTDQIRLLRA